MNWQDAADALRVLWTVIVRIVAVIGAGAVLAGFAAVVLRRSPRGASWFAVQPLRAAARRGVRTGAGDRRSRRFLRRTHRAVIAEFAKHLRGGSGTDVNNLVWNLLLAARPHAVDEPRPYACPEFRHVYALLSEARSPELRGLFLHFQVPELWASCDARLGECVAYMEQFIDLQPVDAVRRTPSMREFATAFTGAAVLADGCGVQGGVLDSIEVFHRGRWDGPDAEETEENARALRATPYDVFHASGRSHEMRARTVGQYDGRVPTLVSVSVVERPARAGAQVVLVTDESCYATTEPPQVAVGVGDVDFACKRLRPAREDPHMAQFHQLHEGAWTYERVPRSSGRTVLLNVVLGLLSTPPGSFPSLVFAIRSLHVRNGAGGLAPAAGGVIELAAGRARKDSDRFGSVDPRSGVLRECREELGFEPDSDSLHPASVFLSTTRGRPLAADAPRLDTGELVASILYLGSTQRSLEQIRESSWLADPVEGAYESRGFVSISLGDSAATFVETLRASRFNGTEVDPSPDHGELLLDCLGQSGVLSCLYASARVHGAAETVRAFATLGPWWIDDWPDAVPGGASRICRGFDHWLGLDRARTEAVLDQLGGTVGFEHLDVRLRQP